VFKRLNAVLFCKARFVLDCGGHFSFLGLVKLHLACPRGQVELDLALDLGRQHRLDGAGVGKLVGLGLGQGPKLGDEGRIEFFVLVLPLDDGLRVVQNFHLSVPSGDLKRFNYSLDF